MSKSAWFLFSPSTDPTKYCANLKPKNLSMEVSEQMRNSSVDRFRSEISSRGGSFKQLERQLNYQLTDIDRHSFTSRLKLNNSQPYCFSERKNKTQRQREWIQEKKKTEKKKKKNQVKEKICAIFREGEKLPRRSRRNSSSYLLLGIEQSRRNGNVPKILD